MIDIILWFLFPIALVLFGWGVEDGDWFVGTLLTVAMLWAGIHFLHITAWVWLQANWLLLVKWSWLYVLVGIAWSIVKVYTDAASADADRFKSYGVGSSTAEENAQRFFKTILAKTPKWIAFWPASLAWSMVHTWLHNVFYWISAQCTSMYKRVFWLAVKEKVCPTKP